MSPQKAPFEPTLLALLHCIAAELAASITSLLGRSTNLPCRNYEDLYNKEQMELYSVEWNLYGGV